MLIAVPVEKKSLEVDVCPSFGRAPIYVLYDSETLATKYLENPAVSAQGGAGIKAAQFLADHQVDTIITPRLGQNAADVLLAAGAKIYQSMPEPVSKNILKLETGELRSLTQFHAGFHGVGQ